jgi:hypothetical protein
MQHHFSLLPLDRIASKFLSQKLSYKYDLFWLSGSGEEDF